MYIQLCIYIHTIYAIYIYMYRVRQNKVIPCSVWLISQERSWIFIRKFTRPLVIHIYVQLPNYIIFSQQLTKLCYLNRDKPTLYNVQILRLRYWHVSRRSGCTQTVQRSLRGTSGHQIPQISTPLTITCGEPCWKGITNSSRSQRQSPS